LHHRPDEADGVAHLPAVGDHAGLGCCARVHEAGHGAKASRASSQWARSEGQPGFLAMGTERRASRASSQCQAVGRLALGRPSDAVSGSGPYQWERAEVGALDWRWY
jgi:hypothetical protein